MPAFLQDGIPWCRLRPRKLALTPAHPYNRKATPHSRRIQPMKRLALLSVAFALAARADEGMWTFDNFPAKKVRQKYGFSPDAQWLQQAQLASVRLAGGCSGSFVRSEEHTSELQSRPHLVCRLLLEKKQVDESTNRMH